MGAKLMQVEGDELIPIGFQLSGPVSYGWALSRGVASLLDGWTHVHYIVSSLYNWWHDAGSIISDGSPAPYACIC